MSQKRNSALSMRRVSDRPELFGPVTPAWKADNAEYLSQVSTEQALKQLPDEIESARSSIRRMLAVAFAADDLTMFESACNMSWWLESVIDLMQTNHNILV